MKMEDPGHKLWLAEALPGVEVGWLRNRPNIGLPVEMAPVT